MLESATQLLVIAAASFAVYAIASLGFLLVYLPSRFFNFTAAIPILTGPYLAYAIGKWSGSFTLGCLASIAIAAMIGGLAYQVLFRRLDERGYSSTIQLTATLGVYVATVGVIGLAFGQQSIRLGPSELGTFALPLAVRVSFAQALSIALAAMTVLLFVAVWQGTAVGLRLRAMADDVSLARIMGIPVSRYATSTFAVGFALLGVAGILGGLDSAMRPTFAFPYVVVAMVAVAVGQGNRRVHAALGSSGVIAISETAVAWVAGEAWGRAVSLVCLILILAWAGTQRRQTSRAV